jgi:hypothetical protein
MCDPAQIVLPVLHKMSASIVDRVSQDLAMGITAKTTIMKKEPARYTARAIALVFISGALWALAPCLTVQAHADSGKSTLGSGRMLIPSGVPGQAGRSIDRAIAREKHTATPHKHGASGAAADAIYRIEPTAAPRRGDRIMT